MKIKTRLAIFVLAAVLSIVGFGVLADALSADHIMAATQPQAQVTVEVTG